MPVAAQSPATVATPPALAPGETRPPPPTPILHSPAPIPPRVSRELGWRDTKRCRGGRVSRPVLSAIYRGNTPIAMVYHWTMRLWCQCWRRAQQLTRLSINTAPPKTRRTCRPHIQWTYLNPTMCPMSRSRPMQTCGDTPCTRNSMVFYRQAPSSRRRPSS